MITKSETFAEGSDLISTVLRLGEAIKRLEAAQGAAAVREVKLAYNEAGEAVNRVSRSTQALAVEVGGETAAQQKRGISPV